MKIEFEITKKTMLKTVLVLFLMVLMAFAGFTVGVSLTYPVAQKIGYEKALGDVGELLKQKGIELKWQDLGNGQYLIQVLTNGQLAYQTTFEIHMLVEHYRNGVLLSSTFHPMTVVDQGKDWVEQQLFNPNNTQKAIYIGCSNDETAVSTSWTSLPNEINANGISRQAGTYTSTGVGAANVTYTYTITGTVSTCLYGIHYSSSGTTLIAAEQQGAANRKNMVSGDTLKITVMWSHS